ncbi:hypothetical protein SUGI_0059570 [Cryptomeria japonica]|nr:hypothetical protein SUGI_0059570 [Cryptomeria japonica]
MLQTRREKERLLQRGYATDNEEERITTSMSLDISVHSTLVLMLYYEEGRTPAVGLDVSMHITLQAMRRKELLQWVLTCLCTTIWFHALVPVRGYVTGNGEGSTATVGLDVSVHITPKAMRSEELQQWVLTSLCTMF